jgi:hypothetical protein
MPTAERVARLIRQLQPLNAAATDVLAGLSPPPTFECREGTVFPTFGHMLEDFKTLDNGGLFCYNYFGGRRIIIVADPSLFDVVFNPGEFGENEEVGDAVYMEMDKIAYAWFGIPKECGPHTRDGLNAVRQQLVRSSEPGHFNDKVCVALTEQFRALPDQGSMQLFDLASSTFWPVNMELFGEDTINPALCPHALQWFQAFDKDLPLYTQGFPKDDDHRAAAASITGMFVDAIKNGVHKQQTEVSCCHTVQLYSQRRAHAYAWHAVD